MVESIAQATWARGYDYHCIGHPFEIPGQAKAALVLDEDQANIPNDRSLMH